MRYASGLAIKAKVAPLIVGLTVVAIGTSSPELFASIQAALNGSGGHSCWKCCGIEHC